jgi:hypothetical protein
MRMRPETTSQLIYESCGRYKPILSNTYGGANETPLDRFSTLFNEEEILAALSGFWICRGRKDAFHEFTSHKDRHDIFKIGFDIGFPRLRSRGKPVSNISYPLHHRLRVLQERLNPFQYMEGDFNDRLDAVPDDAVEELIERLHKRRNIYITRGKRNHLESLGKLGPRHVAMDFQPYSFHDNTYEEICQNYADELERLLNAYPREIDWPREQKQLF